MKLKLGNFGTDNDHGQHFRMEADSELITNAIIEMKRNTISTIIELILFILEIVK